MTQSHTDLVLTEHRVGTGRYGGVYLAFWLKQLCAVKSRHKMSTEDEREKHRQEISILSKLKHPHIIHFLGEVMHNGVLVIVMEYAENGSLQNTIRNHGLSDWSEKERIAQEIARGLAYLHSQEVLHCDLKSGNVLLDHSMRAKICDFGMSIAQSSLENDLYTFRGTFQWLAPELLITNQPKYTTKSDMYALGCILWEMAANSTPPFVGLDQTTFTDCVKVGKREEIPNETPDEYRLWIEQCWSHDPKSRPEAIEIVVQHVFSEKFIPIGVCEMEDISSSTVGSHSSVSSGVISSEEEDTVQPPADGQDEPQQLSVAARNMIRAIESALLHMRFYRKTMRQLFDDSKGVSTHHGVNDDELIKILQKVYLLAVQLSASGVALLIDIDSFTIELASVREILMKLQSTISAPTSSSSNNSSDDTTAGTPETIEQEERAELAAAQAKLTRHRSSADKLFGDYKIRPDDLRRFVLPKESLKCEMFEPITEDDISKIYEGEITQGSQRGEKVHVKYLKEIDGGSTKDIIQRTIFLTYLLRSCENVVRPRFVVMPNLILLEPTTLQTLADYPLEHSQKVDVAIKIAGALALVHSFKIVHRDVRASNVVMSKKGDGDSAVIVPKLTAFEICRHIQYDYSLGPVVKRSVWHAPERVSWHGTSFKTDVFSFGVLMYEISMGRPPEMGGSDVKHADVQDWIHQ
ncbi:hypothetical protein DFQ26_001135, partial [Actinomortierella ambigua]